MLFRNYRMMHNLDRYLFARQEYQDWRDRFIVQDEVAAKKQQNGLRDARHNMRQAVKNLIYLGATRDSYNELKDGTQFIIYSDPKCSVERKIWVKP